LKRYRAVVFDWDGTVMDSTHSIVSAIQGACVDLSLPVPSRRDASWVIGLSLESALYRCVPDLTAENFPLFVERYRHHFLTRDIHDKLFDGIRELFGELRERGVLLGVATGKSRIGLDRVMASMRLRDVFDATRCADETLSKPDPLMLTQIMDKLALRPENVLMIGDTTHDVQMAFNAGVDSLAVTYGAHDVPTLVQANPGDMVATVADMRTWLLERVPD
jgi:phosphoglycolate phosphatase